jgi:L-lactate dehydrogenase complex protein LldE
VTTTGGQHRWTTKVKAVADSIEIPGAHVAPPLHATLMITCVVDVVVPEIGEATVRLLRAAGCAVTCDLDQTCCGYPAWSAGLVEEAAAVARPTLDALEAELDRGAAVVVVPAGSCATMVRRHWPDLFDRAGDLLATERARFVAGRTRELSELLTERSGALPPLRLARPTRVALHRSCRQHRDVQVTARPAELLARVEGCQPVDWPGADRCCRDLDDLDLDVDLDHVDLVVGCDTSCLLHLRSRYSVEVRHLAEVLAEALPAAAGWSAP